MTELQGRGRGPDPAELSIKLAFDDVAARVIKIRRLQHELLKEADGLHIAKARLWQVADTDVQAEFGREVGAVVAMRGGVPLWDRVPIDP